MKITIKKWHHSPNILQRLMQAGIYQDKQQMERIVEFDITAKYDLGNSDNNDVNKLFGIGYLNGLHQTDSARFGWNWNQEAGMVSLFAYCYVHGERIINKICDVTTNKKILLSIYNLKNRYSFLVHDARNTWHQLAASEVLITHKKKWSYRLGSYFGGNNPAPHDITIKISKK